MQRITEGQNLKADEAEIKQRIFERVRQRMQELGHDNPFQEAPVADVIIMPEDQSLLLEPQNFRASELLSQRRGSGLESFTVKGRVRVRPVGNQKTITDFTLAGLKIAHEQGA